MVAPKDANGDDPGEPRSRLRMAAVAAEPRTVREALEGYGTVAANYNDFVQNRLPSLERDVDEGKAAAMAACGMAKEARDEVRALRSALALGPHIPPLPAMRPQLGSTHDVAKAVGGDIAQAYEADLKNPSTPPVPSPQTLGQMVEQRVAVELARVKEIAKQEQVEKDAAAFRKIQEERALGEANRLAALQLAAARQSELEVLNGKERVKFKWASRLAILVAFLGILAWTLEHFVGREGHKTPTTQGVP
jgi:hypothetical protein